MYKRGETVNLCLYLQPLIGKGWHGFCCCSLGSVCLSFVRNSDIIAIQNTTEQKNMYLTKLSQGSYIIK